MPPPNDNPQSQQERDPAIAARTIINFIENDKTIPRVDIINGKPGIDYFIPKYKEIGVDLEKVRVSRNEEKIKDNWAKGIEHGIGAQLAEILPLFANAKGRLGDYIEAKVIKTNKLDDQGNTAVDLILVLKNKWVVESGNQDVPEEMSFLIDVTTGDQQKKQTNLINSCLAPAVKANVKCYERRRTVKIDGKEKEITTLGLERPKLVVTKTSDYLHTVAVELDACVRENASDSFTLTKPELFDEVYRKYFNEFIDGCKQNAITDSGYLRRLHSQSPKHMILAKDYEKMSSFLEFYRKTPTKKVRNYDIA